MRITADHVGTCRSAEPHAVAGNSRGLYETFVHGRPGTLGVQESAHAAVSRDRRQSQVFFIKTPPGTHPPFNSSIIETIFLAKKERDTIANTRQF